MFPGLDLCYSYTDLAQHLLMAGYDQGDLPTVWNEGIVRAPYVQLYGYALSEGKVEY